MSNNNFSIVLLIVAAFFNSYRAYRYTKIYYKRQYGIEFSFWTICGLIISFKIDSRLILFLPILREEDMDSKEIRNSNIFLILSLIFLILCIVIEKS